MSFDPFPPRYVRAVFTGPVSRISRHAFDARTRELVPVAQQNNCAVVWYPFELIGENGALALPASISVGSRDTTCDDILILTAATSEVQIDMFANGDSERGSLPDFTAGDASLTLANSPFDCQRLPSLDPAVHPPAVTPYYHGVVIRGCWSDEHWISIRLQTRELNVLDSMLACIDLRRGTNPHGDISTARDDYRREER
ncbi:hypothetical protein [Gemmatimonas sp.]|uniref:hypothetical protein n=1 Tax=Gemmatimonas sp. TaxID=1962908 RepID=UPI0033407B0D